MKWIDLIALDADDTLWHNEPYYTEAQAEFTHLLSRYHDPDWVQERLDGTEARNMAHYGYGIKAFALSMIETAIELTEGRITGEEVQVILERIKRMLAAPVELLPHASETLAQLSGTFPLMLITKGDLLDQQKKVARSGLAENFRHIEVVSEKDENTYRELLARHGVHPDRFLMVGNSLRSDILPVLALGGTAVYIPYATTWQYEAAAAPANGTPGYYQVDSLAQLPDLLASLTSTAASPDAPAVILSVEDDPRQADVDAVVNGLRGYNEAVAGTIGYRALTLLLRDRQGKVLGGLLGDIYWNNLSVNILWLEDSLRGQGWGARLMKQAESIARESGCVQVHLDTMSFQARPFYEKLGYAVFGQMDDVPIGHQRYYMIKKF